jgi:hypothetical protein
VEEWRSGGVEEWRSGGVGAEEKILDMNHTYLSFSILQRGAGIPAHFSPQERKHTLGMIQFFYFY